MRKLKIILAWILLPVFCCAIAAGVEAACSTWAMKLAAAERVSVSVDLAACTVTGNESEEEDEWDEEEDEEDWDEDEESEEDEDEAEEETAEPEEDTAVEQLTLESETSLLTIPYHGYVHELTLTGSAPTSERYLIRALCADGTSKTYSALFNTSIGEDTTVIDANVTGFEISYPAGGMEITAIDIHNDWQPNINRILLSSLLSACVYLLIVFRRSFGKKPERAFLCIALCMGLYLSCGLPANISLTADDQIHIERVVLLSYGPNSHTTPIAEMLANLTWSVDEDGEMSHRMDTQRDELAFCRKLDEASMSDAGEAVCVHWAYSDTGYAAQAAGMAIARLCGLPFRGQPIAARMANMLLYVFLCFLAIRVLKRWKLVMMAAALAPAALFQACNITYDPTGVALCYLGIALVMDAMTDRSTVLTRGRGFGILFCLLIGSLTKVVYMPLLLLVLLLPGKKFSSKGAHVWFKLMAVVICLAAIGSMVMNVNSGMVQLEDSRGNGNSGAQMAFILSNPIQYFLYFVNWFFANLKNYFVTTGRMNWGYVGTGSETLAWISFALLAIVMVFDNEKRSHRELYWYQRLGMLVVAGMVIGMVLTTMYIAYSEVGSGDFSGVQARYLLPVLPVLYMVIGPNAASHPLGKTQRTLLFGLAQLAVLAVMAVSLVYGQMFLG